MNYSFKDIEVGEFFKDEEGIVRQKDSEYKAVDRNGVEWHYFNLKTAQYTLVDQEDVMNKDDEEFYVCPSCGHEDHADKFGVFCPSCGQNLDELEAELLKNDEE